jgi:hypothetical protein
MPVLGQSRRLANRAFTSAAGQKRKFRQIAVTVSSSAEAAYQAHQHHVSFMNKSSQ